jgi:cysteine-rich repeat protein
MRARYFLGVLGLSACQLIFDPTEERFLETNGNNCFDGVDNDGKNGADCLDTACVEICNDDQLFIEALTSNNCTSVNQEAITDDDRGGIAIGDKHVILSGDKRSGGFTLDDLDGTQYTFVYDGLFSDLRSGKVYTMVDLNDFPITGPAGSATGFQEINTEDGNLIGAVIPLTQPLGMGGVGFFSGKGRVVVVSEGNAFDVDITTGAVTGVGEVSLNHQECENKGFWGVAEFKGTELSLVYASNAKTITRRNISTGEEEVVSGFGHIGDMCSITVAPRLGRWYFHAEPLISIAPVSESIGYCTALFSPVTTPAACGDGIAQGDEQCDDGNQLALDGCTECRIDTCGDGVINQNVHDSFLEACDDGNNTFGDGCRGDCLGVEACGDGLFDPATERCDDGNNTNGDGCEANCQFICADSLNPKMAFFDAATNHCYAVPEFVDVWQGVRDNCVALGGDLVSITSDNEQVLISPAKVHGPWIGLNDIEVEGTFTWSDGQPFSFENFADGEPNNAEGLENCIGLFDTGEWNDFFCDDFFKGICEFDCAASPASCQ